MVELLETQTIAQFAHSDRLVNLLPKIAAGRMQSFDRLCCLAQCAFDVQNLSGDVVEFGCHAGGTAYWLRGLLPDKKLWLYDTFTGQPEDGEYWKRGDMRAVCAPDDIPNTTVVVGDIRNLTEASDFLPQGIILAHVDLDNYESTLYGLKLLWPRLHHAGVVIVDDYHDLRFPGVKRAVDEFRNSFSDLLLVPILESAGGCAGITRTSVVLKRWPQ